MATYHIKKGYSIPMRGEPARNRVALDTPKTLGICPTDFKGIKPKLTVTVNDPVKIGTPLFFDKKNPDIKFVSPAGGTVKAVNYGPRRKLLDVIIEVSDNESHEEFTSLDKEQLKKESAENVTKTLLDAGLWPLIRRRPFNTIAAPDEKPKSLFVNCMNTAPLAADPAFAMEGQDEQFATGIEALKRLVETIHVVTGPGGAGPFGSAEGVQFHEFSGKHPAGLVGTHISKLDPINKGECVWVINARDVVSLGQFFLTGRYPTKRVIAVSGSGVEKPQYVETRSGISFQDLVGSSLKEGVNRVISGNVLTGTDNHIESFLGFYDGTVTVVPEPKEKQFLGWLMPGFNKPSYSRTFFSKLIPGKTFDFTTHVNGGRRAMIQSGLYEDVVALDVMPEHLVKAVLCKDIELMEKLGILECDEEDFALCSYICPSKMEISGIIAEGLELMEKEG